MLKIPKRLVTLAALFSCAIVSTLGKGQETCHALVMSGGANKGAYEAGVIYGLAHLLPADDVTYDVVTGVSAGSINTMGVSIWPVGQEVAMSEWLVDLCMSLTTPTIYKEWVGGMASGVLLESGIFNDNPLLEFLTSIIQSSQGLKRRITVSTVDVNTGTYHTFDESLPIKDLPLAAVSSSSIPFVFPHRKWGNNVFMDGGTVWNTNLVSAVDKCLEVVDHDSKIIVDIIMCDSASIAPENHAGDTVDNYMRYKSIKSYYKTMNDVLEFQEMRPDVQYRYLFLPSEPLTSGKAELEFNSEVMGPMIQVGKNDAQKMVQLGKGKGFHLLKEWKMFESTLKKEFKTFENFLHHHTKAMEN